MQHVFIVGAKSLGAYGGYETFVYKLTEYQQKMDNDRNPDNNPNHDDNLNNKAIKYHIACKANGDGCMDESKLDGVKGINGLEFEFYNAHCFKIPVPNIGAAAAIYYDMKALQYCCKYIENNQIKHPIVYILACRIGPFMGHYYREIHKLGGRVYLNPDGHEWMRKKWSVLIQKYWKLSEQIMVRHADLVICDSLTIEKYIHRSYDGKGTKVEGAIKSSNPNTTYIAYGADTQTSILSDDSPKFLNWLIEKKLKSHEYYLVVGRFVPENNYETMIREFMKSSSKKDLAIITNVNQKFLDKLEKKLRYRKDGRIKFVGTVYDQELLKKIRENAYGYFHGHEVGGTNPSLLEALGSTDLNLLLDVGFNREVAEENALYWTKERGNLSRLIGEADKMEAGKRKKMGEKAKKRISENFSWEYIGKRYEAVFIAYKDGVYRYDD